MAQIIRGQVTRQESRSRSRNCAANDLHCRTNGRRELKRSKYFLSSQLRLFTSPRFILIWEFWVDADQLKLTGVVLTCYPSDHRLHLHLSLQPLVQWLEVTNQRARINPVSFSSRHLPHDVLPTSRRSGRQNFPAILFWPHQYSDRAIIITQKLRTRNPYEMRTISALTFTGQKSDPVGLEKIRSANLREQSSGLSRSVKIASVQIARVSGNFAQWLVQLKLKDNAHEIFSVRNVSWHVIFRGWIKVSLGPDRGRDYALILEPEFPPPRRHVDDTVAENSPSPLKHSFFNGRWRKSIDSGDEKKVAWPDRRCKRREDKQLFWGPLTSEN